MRLHRFFVERPLEHTLETIDDDRLLHQWRSVFRYNVGSEVILFDGSGNEYDCFIEKLGNREAKLRLVSERKGVVPERKIALYQSLIKKDKFEWVVEKATELGVSKIVPVVSERSEKKGVNQSRLQKIAIEASEQCGRADVPIISQVMSLDETLKGCDNLIVFDPSGESLELKAKSLEQKKTLEAHASKLLALGLFVGPEGGWTEKEMDLFKQKGARVYSLSSLTLRSETAAIVALAKLIL
jgi:16S rRNA (uracil1498-N3)-methyltransferase